MTDAPETMWATQGDAGTGSWNAEKSRLQFHMPDDWQIEYRRADLPATNAQANENENVKVLVGLLQWLDRAGGLGLDRHERIRTALAAMKE